MTDLDRLGESSKSPKELELESGPPQRRKAPILARWAPAATSAGIVVALLIAWQILSDTGVIDPFFFSSPSSVGSRLKELLVDSSFWYDTWVTLQESIFGYLIGSAIGVLVGFALGQSRFFASALMPLINLANTLPRVALAPLFILWFGIGQESKVILVVTVVVTIVIFNTFAGTQTLDSSLETSARLLGASRLQVLWRVTLPWTLPWILTGLQIALAWSLGAAVIGEYIASKAGLGHRIFTYGGVLDQTGLLAGCAMLLALSALMFGILGAVERHLLRWRPESGR